MKRTVALLLVLCAVLSLAGCGAETAVSGEPSTEPALTSTPTPTPEPPYVAETYSAEGDEPYYRMSDGTWMAGDYTYKYRFELSGRLPNAKRDSIYVVLSNVEDITFEQAYKSIVGSHTDDFFEDGEAVIVESRKGDADASVTTTYSVEGGATYYEMSDGTWTTESGETYKYRYVLTGTHPESGETVTYVALSHREVTFDEVYAAAENGEEAERFEVVAVIPAG